MSSLGDVLDLIHSSTRRFRTARAVGCVVLGLRSDAGIAMAGVVESGYGRELVERLPTLTRADIRGLQKQGRLWEGTEPLVGAVKYLEWSAAGGLRHASLLSFA
jgi:ATP-dependent DNA ligase